MPRAERTEPIEIFVAAGEPSGDVHASGVMRAFAKLHPDTTWWGIGGPQMREAGAEVVADVDRLAVMGIAEVLPRIPYFVRLERRLVRMLDERRPRAVLLVDYPAFNLRLARAAHRRGIPVVYYVAPKVWAWGRRRAATLAERADRIGVIFPFEVDLFREHGGDARYVGHPLLDRPDHVDSREAFYDRWGLDPDRSILALLPGSRSQEIRRHLGLCQDVATAVAARRPDVLPVLSRAPSVSALPFHETGLALVEDTRGLLRHAAAALVTSGTATLEAALERRPMVVVYRTSPLTAAVARQVLKVRDIGLPNLVAGRRVVPEYVQEETDPVAIADRLLSLLDPSTSEHRQQLLDLDGVRDALGSPGAADRVAGLLDEVVA